MPASCSASTISTNSLVSRPGAVAYAGCGAKNDSVE